MASILIAGCGDLGSGVAIKLVEQGHQVQAIRRSKNEFPVGVTGIVGDITELPETAFPTVDIVYLIMTPQGRTAAAYDAAYLATSQRLARIYLKKATQDGPHIIFVSSSSVYGAEQDGVLGLGESTPAIPSSETAKVLRQAENVWLEGSLSHTLMRFSGIYGPGRNRTLDKIAQGQGFSAANQWTNRIHRDDCVESLVFLAQCYLTGTKLAPLYIGTDSAPVSQWELVNWLAAHMNVAQSLDPALTLTDMVPAKGKQLSSQALQDLGYQFLYPSYVQGYQALLADYLKTDI
jgi:nucleoside-diphosphate-sugar epimerase